MTDKEEKFVNKISEKIRMASVHGIASDYRAMAQTILDMIDEGKTLAEIGAHCEWAVKTNDDVEKVAMGLDKQENS